MARISSWNLDGVALEPDGSVVVRVGLACGIHANPHVPRDLMLAYELRLGRGLSIALTVTNPADVPTTFEIALHTYLAVGDVRRVSAAGLAGAFYVDKVDCAKRKTQTGALITNIGETDRLYLDTGAVVTLEDPGLGRRIRVAKTGCSTRWDSGVPIAGGGDRAGL